MIRYALKCAKGHQFESWFRDSKAYDDLAQAGRLSCAICGIETVEKAIMAPRVNVSDEATPRKKAANDPADNAPKDNTSNDGPLSQPTHPAEAALRELREHIEKNATDVGDNFADEARAIHDGDKPERAIFGQAKLEDAKALIEDGVPVAPLPWIGKTRN